MVPALPFRTGAGERSFARSRSTDHRAVRAARPGHARPLPGALCLWEPHQRWLFSGDLFVAADLDSQLCDVDGPAWVASLDRALSLRPRAMFDAHGTILMGEDRVAEQLSRKRDGLVA